MNSFIDYLKLNKYFLSLFLVYLLTTSIYILSTPKGAFLLWLNSLNNSFLDYFFYYFTFVGDGLFVIALALIFTLFNYKNAINLFTIYAISGLLAQLLKVIFNTPRPKAYFEGIKTLHLLPWVNVYSTYSMPSGHTTTAFALAFFLSTVITNKIYQTMFFILAIIVALSRVYLCQHFPEDTIVGAFIGISIAIICDYYFGSYLTSKEKFSKGILRK